MHYQMIVGLKTMSKEIILEYFEISGSKDADRIVSDRLNTIIPITFISIQIGTIIVYDL